MAKYNGLSFSVAVRLVTEVIFSVIARKNKVDINMLTKPILLPMMLKIQADSNSKGFFFILTNN
jgi:hypothetical protein